MSRNSVSTKLGRRTVIKAAAAAGVAQFASPFVWSARAADTIKVGMIDPFTGVYAAVAQNELIGAKFAVEQINAKGGVLGRQIELLVEDSANDVGTGVQKARKLIDRDGIQFLIGDVNSGIALAIAQVSNEKKVLHVVSGGHTDGITGKDCHWNVYRVCNTTTDGSQLGRRAAVQQIRQEVAFHHAGLRLRPHAAGGGGRPISQKFGGTVTGNELTPLGTTDFSAYLIKASAANPDVLLVLPQGLDMVNCLKQIAQFGIDKQIHVAGLQQELESLEAMPPEARIGIWMFEWYWKQPGVPGVEQFVADIRKRSGGHVPTARTWFGYTSMMIATRSSPTARRRSTASSSPRRWATSSCRPTSSCSPTSVYYRKGDHQLMTSAFVGEALSKPAGDPEDLFMVDTIVPGDKTSPPETRDRLHLARGRPDAHLRRND